LEIGKSLEFIENRHFLVEVYGLGYVGFPLAVKLSQSGLNVIGIDVNTNRINRLRENQLLDSEIYLKKGFEESKNKGKLILKNSPEKSELPKIGIICVPTPIPNEKTQSDIYVKSAVETFVNFAKAGDVIILESSVEVGTTEKMIKLIEMQGFKVGKDFGVCMCPERVDPANKKWKLENIPRVIYCSDDQSFRIAKEIYMHVNGSYPYTVNPLDFKFVINLKLAESLISSTLGLYDNPHTITDFFKFFSCNNFSILSAI